MLNAVNYFSHFQLATGIAHLLIIELNPNPSRNVEAQLIGKIHVRFRGICLKYFYRFYIALNETDETESACLICRLCDKLIIAYCITLNLIGLIKQPFSIEYVYVL